MSESSNSGKEKLVKQIVEQLKEPAMRNAVDLLLEKIEPGKTLLDLGAWRGEKAKRFQDKGAQVTAVERNHFEKTPEGIEWHEMTIEQFIERAAGRTFDYVVLNNVLQYYEHDEALARVLPQIKALVKEGGTLALETFTKHPEPAFSTPHAAVFSKEELEAAFADWPKTNVWVYEGVLEGLDKISRKFFIADLLAEKPDQNPA